MTRDDEAIIDKVCLIPMGINYWQKKDYICTDKFDFQKAKERKKDLRSRV